MHVNTKFVFFTELFETKKNYAKEMGRKKEEKRIYISIKLIIAIDQQQFWGKFVGVFFFKYSMRTKHVFILILIYYLIHAP